MNKIDVQKVSKNPIRGGKMPPPTIKLPDYPITEVFRGYGDKEVAHPVNFDQNLYFCSDTNHGFLGNLLPQNFIYGDEHYNTSSAGSQGSMTAINNFYAFIVKNIEKKSHNIVDIGANDATLLRMFENTGAKLIGIDPNIKSQSKNIITVNDYLENVNLANYLPQKEKNIILCSHTLEHIYDPNMFFQIIADNTTVEDELFFQFPSLELLIEDNRFDQIHHQHINYYSLQSVSTLISEYGFEVLDHYFDYDHYGALMIYFKKSKNEIQPITNYNFPTENEIMFKYENFLLDMEVTNNRLASFKGDFYCFGASLMLPILSYYLPEMCNCKAIIDDDSSKHDLCFVNFNSPIIGRDEIKFEKENFLITAIATKSATRKILGILSDLNAKNIILPLSGV